MQRVIDFKYIVEKRSSFSCAWTFSGTVYWVVLSATYWSQCPEHKMNIWLVINVSWRQMVQSPQHSWSQGSGSVTDMELLIWASMHLSLHLKNIFEWQFSPGTGCCSASVSMPLVIRQQLFCPFFCPNVQLAGCSSGTIAWRSGMWSAFANEVMQQLLGPLVRKFYVHIMKVLSPHFGRNTK